jgi:hypothetical protein
MTACRLVVSFLILILLSSTGGALAQTITVPPSPSSNQLSATLYSVCVVNKAAGNSNGNISDYEAWAVGQTGVVLHWDGQKWMQVLNPTSMNLYGVFMVNSSSGWAVGGSDTRGIILHYDGKNWTEWANIFNPSTNNATITTALNSVAFDENGTTGVIVGPQGSMYRWNGSGWVGTPQMNVTLRGISFAPHTSDAWVCGDNGTILTLRNGAWTKVNSSTAATVRTISVGNSTSGWAAGGDDGVGLLLSLNATGWSKWDKISFSANSTSDKVNVTLNALSISTSNYGWVVGDAGWMLKWNGSVWVGQTGKTSFAVTSVSLPQNVTSMGWAVGDSGTILVLNGTEWKSIHATDIPELPTPLLAAFVLVTVFAAAAALTTLKRNRPIN